MEQPFDLATLQSLLDSGLDWAETNILSWRVALELIVLAATYLVARLIGQRLSPIVQRRLASPGTAARVKPLLTVLAQLLVPLIFLLLLWLVAGLLRQMAWPSASYLLTVALSLVTAWVVIRASASLIRNVVMSKTIAVIAWTVAALSITELLAPTVALLDSLAITLGDLRISALLVIEGVISMAVLLWGALALSNLISGIILLLDKSIKPGDVIELGSTFGWIQSLGARYVSVVTRDGKEYLIPNEDLITQPVVNWSYTDQLVRMEATIGVA